MLGVEGGQEGKETVVKGVDGSTIVTVVDTISQFSSIDVTIDVRTSEQRNSSPSLIKLALKEFRACHEEKNFGGVSFFY